MRQLELSLYLVTDTTLCGARGVPETVRAAVAGGVTVVQLRDPRATGRELYEAAVALRAIVTDVPLIVNDRLDIALAAGADGVHLGQSDLPVARAREIAGADFVIGWSAATAEEIAYAEKSPGIVDYLGIGPVFTTPTKPDAGPGLGPDLVAELAGLSSLPTVAIGGINLENASQIRGVDGICVVSAICSADDPRAAAEALREARK
jgi:thiamine-phosphate pyrophosphorylase